MTTGSCFLFAIRIHKLTYSDRSVMTEPAKQANEVTISEGTAKSPPSGESFTIRRNRPGTSQKVN